MRLLGIDYGSKRLGVAFGDTGTRIAIPRTTIPNNGKLFSFLEKLCQTEGVGGVVIGLPLGMEGHETAQTQKTQIFGKRLSRALALPVYFSDERLTTKFVNAEIREGKTRRDRVDASAAALILQGYLDRLRQNKKS